MSLAELGGMNANNHRLHPRGFNQGDNPYATGASSARRSSSVSSSSSSPPPTQSRKPTLSNSSPSTTRNNNASKVQNTVPRRSSSRRSVTESENNSPTAPNADTQQRASTSRTTGQRSETTSRSASRVGSDVIKAESSRTPSTRRSGSRNGVADSDLTRLKHASTLPIPLPPKYQNQQQRTQAHKPGSSLNGLDREQASTHHGNRLTSLKVNDSFGARARDLPSMTSASSVSSSFASPLMSHRGNGARNGAPTSPTEKAVRSAVVEEQHTQLDEQIGELKKVVAAKKKAPALSKPVAKTPADRSRSRGFEAAGSIQAAALSQASVASQLGGDDADEMDDGVSSVVSEGMRGSSNGRGPMGKSTDPVTDDGGVFSDAESQRCDAANIWKRSNVHTNSLSDESDNEDGFDAERDGGSRGAEQHDEKTCPCCALHGRWPEVPLDSVLDRFAVGPMERSTEGQSATSTVDFPLFFPPCGYFACVRCGNPIAAARNKVGVEGGVGGFVRYHVSGMHITLTSLSALRAPHNSGAEPAAPSVSVRDADPVLRLIARCGCCESLIGYVTQDAEVHTMRPRTSTSTSAAGSNRASVTNAVHREDRTGARGSSQKEALVVLNTVALHYICGHSQANEDAESSCENSVRKEQEDARSGSATKRTGSATPPPVWGTYQSQRRMRLSSVEWQALEGNLTESGRQPMERSKPGSSRAAKDSRRQKMNERLSADADTLSDTGSPTSVAATQRADEPTSSRIAGSRRAGRLAEITKLRTRNSSQGPRKTSDRGSKASVSSAITAHSTAKQPSAAKKPEEKKKVSVEIPTAEVNGTHHASHNVESQASKDISSSANGKNTVHTFADPVAADAVSRTGFGRRAPAAPTLNAASSVFAVMNGAAARISSANNSSSAAMMMGSGAKRNHVDIHAYGMNNKPYNMGFGTTTHSFGSRAVEDNDDWTLERFERELDQGLRFE